MLGILHGTYGVYARPVFSAHTYTLSPGVGAFLAPLAATHFSQQRHWSYHYLISLCFALINILALSAVFRFRRQDGRRLTLHDKIIRAQTLCTVLMAEAGQQDNSGEPHQEESNANKYRAMLGIRTVYYLIAFAIIYIGIEASLGGWIVTFIQRERHGGSSSGYISSGMSTGLLSGC